MLNKYINSFCQIIQQFDPLLKQQINKVNFFVPTAGCSKAKKFGPCSMCVFDKPWKILPTSPKKPGTQAILKLYNNFILPSIINYKAKVIQLQIGGSILDNKEFPFKTLLVILNQLPANIQRVELETRPEYITKEKIIQLKNALSLNIQLMIYLGVETSDENYRNSILKKNISDKQILNALTILKKYRVLSGAYILAGLPGYTAKKSIANAIQSIKWCFKIGFDLVHICPTVIPEIESPAKRFFNRHNFQPLTWDDLAEILRKLNDYPVTIADLIDDPPAEIGISGNKDAREIVDNFILTGKIS